MANLLTNLTKLKALKEPDRPAVYRQNADGSRWLPLTWKEFDADVETAAAALASCGIGPADRFAIFTANRVEWLVTDFAAYANRAIPVSIYSTSSLDQVVYIVNDIEAPLIFVGNEKQLDIAIEARRRCPSLKQIVVYEPLKERTDEAEGIITFDAFLEKGLRADRSVYEMVDTRRSEAQPDDIATLIYTSGTTGEPKGAVLPHSCFNATLKIHRERLTSLTKEDTSVAFLPLSHIFEKGWTYVCLYLSMRVWVCQDPRTIQDVLKQVRPTCMCSVPRFWEKVYAGVQEKIASMGWLQRAMVSRALKVGRRRNLDYIRTGRRVPRLLEVEYNFWDRRVFAKLRGAIGFDHPNIFPTAGAPLADEIVRFMHSCGLNLMIGYGLSETTATVSCYPYVGYEIGTVGTTIPRVQVRVGEQDEIQVKGPTVMRGYYNKPEATAEAFTPDGWFRTGDAGRIDASGAIILTERIKDLFKTSNGKYIAPQALESRLGQDKYIEQVAVIGDKRKYVTAIIIPAFEALKEYARKHKISYRSVEELVRNADIRKLIEERIQKLQAGLPGFEQIKNFTLLPREFTMEAGELTNTLKIRRPVIADRYSREIEAMYA